MKWAILLLSLYATALGATNTRHYLADMHQSQWLTKETKLECVLAHTIPRYGVAHFHKPAGEEISFSLSAFNASNRKQNIVIDSTQPEWRFTAKQRNLGSADDSGTHVPFKLSRTGAQRLLYELESGMRPNFSYKDAADATELLLISLSSVNFREAHLKFNHCVAKLLPYGFDDIRFTRVNFEFNSDVLDASMKDEIKRIATYVKYDSTVRRVVVGGHTDWIGTNLYNSDLSKFRTLRVVDYLTDQGIPDNLIHYASFGEDVPLTSNETAAGRADNRRVTLTIIRDKTE